MDVLLMAEEPTGAARLRVAVEALGHRVLGPSPGAREAAALLRARGADLAVVASGDGAAAATEISGAHPVPIVLVVPRRDPALVERTAHLPVFACLVEPVPLEDLSTVLRLARARFEEVRTLRGRVAELSRRMEGRGTVERAKGILMEARGLSEGDAYRLLRRESQNRHRSLDEVAGTIVAMEGVVRARARDAVPAGGPGERAG